MLLPICALVIHSLQSLKLLLSLRLCGEGAGAVSAVAVSALSEGRGPGCLDRRCGGAALLCVSRARHTGTSGEPARGVTAARAGAQARAASRERCPGNAGRAFSTTVFPRGKLGEGGADSGLRMRKGSIPETFMSSSLPSMSKTILATLCL